MGEENVTRPRFFAVIAIVMVVALDALAAELKNVSPSLAVTYYKHFDPDYLKRLPAPPAPIVVKDSAGRELYTMVPAQPTFEQMISRPDDPAVTYYRDTLWVRTYIIFSGDTASFRNMPIRISTYFQVDKLLSAHFPLKSLPEIAAVPGVEMVQAGVLVDDPSRRERELMQRVFKVSDSARLCSTADSVLAVSDLRLGRDSAIWYMDTVKDETRPHATPDLDILVDQSEIVSWVLFDTTYQVVRVLFNDSLPAGHYRFYTKTEFMDRYLAAARFAQGKPAILFSWLKVGAAVQIRRIARVK
jgi:hypothetical protein